MSDELKWTLCVGAAGALASVAARKTLARGWERVAGTPPPNDPMLDRNSAVEAVAWSVAVAGAAGVARLLARRGAAMAWNRAMSSRAMSFRPLT
jgi:hypothetical protein